LLETPDDVLAEILAKTKKIAPAIMKAVGAQGFNSIFNTKPAAGQVIFHTHMHIIPRFANDGLKHWPQKQLSQEEMKKVKEQILKELQ
jgi:histidine triad (HIT) family protein